MQNGLKEVVIPKDMAVFRLDKYGIWHNAGGRFRIKKIIDHFHRSIGHDENGYFVCQVRENIREKVYFPYEETALFVFDVHLEADQLSLRLNTGKTLRLDSDHLYIFNDILYWAAHGELVKFTDRAMMKIAPLLHERNGKLVLTIGCQHIELKEGPPGSLTD